MSRCPFNGPTLPGTGFTHSPHSRVFVLVLAGGYPCGYVWRRFAFKMKQHVARFFRRVSNPVPRGGCHIHSRDPHRIENHQQLSETAGA